jgi:hypothetical protein
MASRPVWRPDQPFFIGTKDFHCYVPDCARKKALSSKQRLEQHITKLHPNYVGMMRSLKVEAQCHPKRKTKMLTARTAAA